MTDKNWREETHEEVEIKLRVRDRGALVRVLARHKARQQGTRMHEMNTLFDTPGGDLMRRGQMLRVRVEEPAPLGRAQPGKKRTAGRPRVRLTYKGPVQDQGAGAGPNVYKVRQEFEVALAEGEAIAAIFGAIGWRPWYRYEKYRSTYRLPGIPGVEVELDETPIGDFVELEGKREAIDRAAALLGYGPEDYITESYGALHIAQQRAAAAGAGRGEPMPGVRFEDLLFPGTK